MNGTARLLGISIRLILGLGLLLALLAWIGPAPARADEAGQVGYGQLNGWMMAWEDSGPPWAVPDVEKRASWFPLDSGRLPERPDGIKAAWLKVRLPDFSTMENPSMYAGKLYARDVSVYTGDHRIYHAARSFNYDTYRLLLPLDREDGGGMLYIRLESNLNRLGLIQPVYTGEHQALVSMYVKSDILDFMLGSSYLVMGLVMLVCSFLLRSRTLRTWLTLSFILLLLGVMVLTDTPFLYSIAGSWMILFYDFSLFLLLPAVCYFFQLLMGPGLYGSVRWYGRGIGMYSILMIALEIADILSGFKLDRVWFFFAVTVLGVLIIAEFVLLLIHSVYYALKGCRDAYVLTAGFSVLSVTLEGEMIWFYLKQEKYDFTLWKWGVLAIVLSLIYVLGRRMAENHEQIIRYAKEREVHTHSIQRAEKMKIISELAASMAHEVRNPLQVTRGFLQIIGRKIQDTRERKFVSMAIDELDRASVIITDYLTFAKPELDQVAELELAREFEQIHGIMSPMASLQKLAFRVDVEEGLRILGSSAKLKQALINIIKNSIEASPEHGAVRVTASREASEAVIRIRDNGAGMDGEALAKLGEPYFSTKTKGTGLGLMVTFRIIELMQGSLHFWSRPGEGTEAVIRFPLSAGEPTASGKDPASA